MDHYRKLNPTHRLASYRVRLPVWTGLNAVRQPFAAWDHDKVPGWFKAHHGGKHNRHSEFPSASLRHVVDAISGVVALLASQFITHDFGPMLLAMEGGPPDGYEHAIGGYFEVKFPGDWPEQECYQFDWETLKQNAKPFRQLSF